MIKIVISAAVVVTMSAFASTSVAQSLQRPVNAEATPETSLGDLASKANPGRNVGAVTSRVYTNADLKLRPAPVLPTMPTFPEISPERGILEYQGPSAIELVPPPQEPGIPVWDLPAGQYLVPFPSGRPRNRGRFSDPSADLHNRFGIFTPGFGLRSPALGAPMGSRRDLFTVKPQGSSKGQGGKGGKKD